MSYNYNAAEVWMSWGTVDKMREEMNLASYALDGIRYWKDEVVRGMKCR